MFRSRQTVPLFPTLVTFYDVDDAAALAGPLLGEVLERSRQGDTVARGERHGGWQSDNGFFEWSDPARQLRRIVAHSILQLDDSNARIEQMNLLGWANLLRRGECFSPHTHSGAWSGVYYVDAGDADEEHG